MARNSFKLDLLLFIWSQASHSQIVGHVPLDLAPDWLYFQSFGPYHPQIVANWANLGRTWHTIFSQRSPSQNASTLLQVSLCGHSPTKAQFRSRDNKKSNKKHRRPNSKKNPENLETLAKVDAVNFFRKCLPSFFRKWLLQPIANLLQLWSQPVTKR